MNRHEKSPFTTTRPKPRRSIEEVTESKEQHTCLILRRKRSGFVLPWSLVCLPLGVFIFVGFEHYKQSRVLIVLDRSSFNTNQNSFTRSVAQQKKRLGHLYCPPNSSRILFSASARKRNSSWHCSWSVQGGVKDFVRAKTKITLFKRRFDANCLPLQPAHEQLSPPQKHPSSSICFCGNSAVWYHFKTRIADKETRQKIRKNKWQSIFLFFCAGENILLAQRA